MMPEVGMAGRWIMQNGFASVLEFTLLGGFSYAGQEAVYNPARGAHAWSLFRRLAFLLL